MDLYNIPLYNLHIPFYMPMWNIWHTNPSKAYIFRVFSTWCVSIYFKVWFGSAYLQAVICLFKCANRHIRLTAYSRPERSCSFAVVCSFNWRHTDILHNSVIRSIRPAPLSGYYLWFFPVNLSKSPIGLGVTSVRCPPTGGYMLF